MKDKQEIEEVIMNEYDYELMLFDRIEKIKQINSEYDLLNNSYISFSGGKDSTVLHYLIDFALPNNNIPRVFLNTGIEHQAIIEFVKELAATDKRIIIVNSGVNIKQMLEKEGYPFKSKEHSSKVNRYQRGSRSASVMSYKDGNNFNCPKFNCPKILQYQFNSDFKLKVSSNCCNRLKKEPIKRWQKANNKPITLTGMRRDEGGQRANIGCLSTDSSGKLKMFHPLLVVNDDFEKEFIKLNNIKLCKLYYPPYNFERTGCKGCPFALQLQKQLDVMERLLPAEKKQCEILWAPVYEEYRRIGYRLRPKGVYKQTCIFDYLEEENNGKITYKENTT